MVYKFKENGWYFNPNRPTQRWNGVGDHYPIWFKDILKKGLNPDLYFIPDSEADKKLKAEIEKNFKEEKLANKPYN